MKSVIASIKPVFIRLSDVDVVSIVGAVDQNTIQR